MKRPGEPFALFRVVIPAVVRQQEQPRLAGTYKHLKHGNRLIFALGIKTCLICHLVFMSGAMADLTEADQTDLTMCLDNLSHGWDQPSVETAGTILIRSEYTAADWESWFDDYFNTTNHPLTDDLRNYLWYPVFGWFDDAVHLKLQMGLVNPMWTKATATVASHPADLGPTLYDDPLLRQSLLNAHVFFSSIAQSGIVDSPTRSNIYQRYVSLIDTYPQFFSDATTVDNFAQPLIALLRTQVWLSFVDTLQFTEDRKTEIAQTISLQDGPSGKKRVIWDANSVLLIENNQLDETQLNVLASLLDKIPAGLSNLRFVTVREFLSAGTSYRPIILRGQTGGAVNYFLGIFEGRLQFSFDGGPGSWPGVTSTQTVTWDAWNHVAATYDGSTMKVYLNGVETGSLASVGVPVSSSLQPLRIGSFPDFNQWMRGSLDEVKIYGRTLTAEEISREHSLQPVSASSLVGSWNMDEGSGTVVADASGLGNHGARNGAVPVVAVVNNGLSFDGKDDYVFVDDADSLRLNGSMTIEAWIYLVNESPWLYCGESEMVNIFGVKVGEATGNPFPSDAAPRTDECFSAVAIHEFNHVVDAHTVWHNPNLNAREGQLIAQAGQEPLQYLRSMVTEADGSSWFPEAPQEFFASISNEYFTDSWNTLDLALLRFTVGYKEPINQFLFFADVYSQGGLSTKVYTTDSIGHITVENAPIGRDAQARIDRVTRSSGSYFFTLDLSGNVTGYTFSEDTDGDGLTDVQEVNLYHTDPLKPDTDADGLTDGEEITVYLTNPLEPDTDGDGVDDGTEVQWGYNPKDPDSTPHLPATSLCGSVALTAAVLAYAVLLMKRKPS